MARKRSRPDERVVLERYGSLLTVQTRGQTWHLLPADDLSFAMGDRIIGTHQPTIQLRADRRLKQPRIEYGHAGSIIVRYPPRA